MNKLKSNLINSMKWRKIKRNGHFGKKRRSLIQSIGNIQVNNICPKPISALPGWAVESASPNGDDSVNENIAANTSIDPIYNPVDQISPSNCAISDNEIRVNKLSFRDEISNWALQNQITQSAIKELLMILRAKLPDEELPVDARTLLGTPREKIQDSLPNDNDKYWHYGFHKVLLNALIARKHLLESQYTLNVNIDGLPEFNQVVLAYFG